MTPTVLSTTIRPEAPTDSIIEVTKSGIQHSVQAVTLSPASPIQNPLPSPTTFSLTPLNASLTHFTPNPSPCSIPSHDHASSFWSQSQTTDHMITANFNASTGWSPPHLRPYAPLSLPPTSSALHYGTSCFEGLKAYRGFDGSVRLFRPALNCARMARSAARVALPDFDPAQLQRLIKKLVACEGHRWLPRERGEGVLYLRPTLIGTGTAIGVQKPAEAMLFIIAMLMPIPALGRVTSTAGSLPVSPPTTDTNCDTQDNSEQKREEAKLGLHLLASSPTQVRSWPGGFGHAKVGANYGPTLAAQAEANTRGFDQVLWLFGREGYVTEAGGSNFFVVWKNREGKRELVTAAIGDGEGNEGLILPGVTRASVLEAVRSRLVDVPPGDDQEHERQEAEGIDVIERAFTISELLAAAQEGRLEEAFSTGTAVFVRPVEVIEAAGGERVRLPLRMTRSLDGEKKGDGQVSGCAVATAVKRFLGDVMYGRVKHDWAVSVEEIA